MGIDMHWATLARVGSKISFLMGLPLKHWQRNEEYNGDGDSDGVVNGGGRKDGGRSSGSGSAHATSAMPTPTTPTATASVLSPLIGSRHPNYHSPEDKGHSDQDQDKGRDKDQSSVMNRDNHNDKRSDKTGGLMIRSGAGTLRVLSAYGEIGN